MTKEDKIKELESFKLPSSLTGITHAKPRIICFVWQNRKIDLRTVSQALAEAVADDPNCGVLQRTSKQAPSASAPNEADKGKK